MSISPENAPQHYYAVFGVRRDDGTIEWTIDGEHFPAKANTWYPTVDTFGPAYGIDGVEYADGEANDAAMLTDLGRRLAPATPTD